MTEWEKKRQNTAESDRKREIDDFWDVAKLLPERPARRTPPPPRPDCRRGRTDTQKDCGAFG